MSKEKNIDNRGGIYRRWGKRALDVTLAGGALVVLALPMAAVATWLYFANRGAGVFFHQERPGRGGRIFRLHKFKSMTDARDPQGRLLPDSKRITAAGRFVRSTSIDELPQLWNVLRGDMSLIGPRPLLPQYLPWYTEEENRRHDVRPGITGYAQSHGRNNIGWDDKLAMDVYYVNNLSLRLDFDILLTTIKNVLSRKDVTPIPHGMYLDQERKGKGLKPNNI